MKGDFSRMTFDPTKHFSRVLMQQGRVQLDADWNEQTAILLHYLQTLAADLIGPHGGPGASFQIVACEKDSQPVACNTDGASATHKDFYVRLGHYYVDGILCELDGEPARYTQQPPYTNDTITDTTDLDVETDYLVYLDVWERHITYLEDEDPQGDEPGIREVALGGPDTTTRAQIVWQVKVEPDIHTCPVDDEDNKPWRELLDKWQPACRLKARAKTPPGQDDTDPCILSPEARYRGVENQLYRVEIHRGGKTWDGEESTKNVAATFKWSRDNGTVVFPIEKIEKSGGEIVVTLEHLGLDDLSTLHEEDWVEIVNDTYVLQGKADSLLKVEKVDRDERKVTLGGAPVTVEDDLDQHPLLRRWDQQVGDPDKGGLILNGTGAALVREPSEGDSAWLVLEDNVMVQFQPPEGPNEPSNIYRTGDYWLIPARTATGDVEWPGTVEAPAARPPHGVIHHYAPLAIINVANDGTVTVGTNECRRSFDTMPQISSE
jgi:hypothetical protein